MGHQVVLFQFLRNRHTILHDGCTDLNFHQGGSSPRDRLLVVLWLSLFEMVEWRLQQKSLAWCLTPFYCYSLPTKGPEGKTYADCDSAGECMDGVCKMYEEHLKRWMNPNSPSVTYDVSQFDFIDGLADLCCLVYPRSSLQTKTALKRRTARSFVGRPNRPENSCAGSVGKLEVGLEHRCVQRSVVDVLCHSNAVSVLVHSSQDWAC